MLVLGLGIGMVMQVLVLAMQNASEPQDMGVVTSSANFFRSLGGSMGISVFGAIFASLLADRLGAFLPPGALDGAGFNPASLSASPEQLPPLPAHLPAPVLRALSESITAVLAYSVPVLTLRFPLPLLPPPPPPPPP